MDFETWLASEHRATWLQLVQDRIVGQGIPVDPMGVARFSAQLKLVQELKEWRLDPEKEKPEETRKTHLKAGEFKR